MELFFLALLDHHHGNALGSGYPVAFALPGAAIITIGCAAVAGYLFGGRMSMPISIPAGPDNGSRRA